MDESKFWFWILLDALLAAVTITVLGVALPATAQWSASIPPARTVTVTAEGMTTATPDLAEITFSVVSQGQNPQALTTDNTAKMNAVLQFVSSQNIATSDVATTGYDLQPNYQYNNNGNQQPSISGYTLTQTVTVKIHDLTNVATVLSGLAPLGVNQIGGVDFTLNDPDSFLGVARADAINKARAKAQELASEAGTSLGAVVNISENGIVPRPLPVFAMAGTSGMAVPAAASTPNIQPGSQDVTDDVTITYALRF
jgi:uncharacterized protein YggE